MMIEPENHINEIQRLALLGSYSILDTLPESDYDNLTLIACGICNTPISLISFVDHKRQWFKSHQGIAESETSRNVSFCAHAINEPGNILIVQDVRTDLRFHDNPFVLGEPNVVFYAGVVLKAADNLPLGTLCVLDSKPHILSQSQVNSLKALSNQVINLLELRKNKILLQKVVEEIEQNNRELERFAFIAAHDLNSPLRNISSLISLIANKHATSMNSQEMEILKLIKNSSDTLRRLIDGLLEYHRSYKTIKEHKIEVNLETLRKDVTELYSFDNKCKITLKTNLINIYTNRTALEQILINLIANANKYSDKEVVDIEIQVKENEKQYHFSVKDNGPGIDKKNQTKIFQMFEKNTTKDKYGNIGHGIGLATVKKIVESLGGEILIESELDKGATFIFTLNK